MRPFALLLFVLFPLVEIGLFALAGDLIGVWPTVLLTVATSALGLALLRGQGLRAARTLAEGTTAPAPALADAAGRSFAAFLLLLPGFLTDAIGLALLVPAIRRLLGAVAWRYVRRHVGVVVRTVDGVPGGRPASNGPTIDGDATEIRETDPPPAVPPTLPPNRPPTER